MPEKISKLHKMVHISFILRGYLAAKYNNAVNNTKRHAHSKTLSSRTKCYNFSTSGGLSSPTAILQSSFLTFALSFESLNWKSRCVIDTPAFCAVVLNLFLPFKVTVRNGKCSRSTILVFVLSIIVVALVICIAVTYSMSLHCDDDQTTNREESGNTTNRQESGNSISFLLYSDIHLDLFYKAQAASGKGSFCRNQSKLSTYNAPYGRIGCDSPLGLLNEVLNAMKQQANNLTNLDFVMLSGK